MKIFFMLSILSFFFLSGCKKNGDRKVSEKITVIVEGSLMVFDPLGNYGNLGAGVVVECGGRTITVDSDCSFRVRN